MPSKFKYVAEHRDEEMASRLKEVLRPVYDANLEEIAKLATAKIDTPYEVDPGSRNAGAAWLKEFSGKSTARKALINELSDRIRLGETILGIFVVKPEKSDPAKAKADADQETTNEAQRVLDAVKGALKPDELKELRAKYGDELPIPHPPGSNPDEDDDA